MRLFLRTAALLFSVTASLVLLVVYVLPSPVPRVAAYNGQCGIILGGTCLVDLYTGISVHRASYGTYVSEWSADMNESAFVSPVDYIIYIYSFPDGTVTPLTQRENVRNFAPSLSPDSSQVAYALSAPDSAAVQLRAVNRDGGNDRYLATLDMSYARFAGDLSWSPTGEHIAFFTSERDASGTNRITLSVLEIASGDVRLLDEINAPTAAWSPDGKYIAYVPTFADTLSIVDVATGYVPDFVRDFLLEPGNAIVGVNVSSPAFSPDGSKLMFVDRDRAADTTAIKVRDLTTGEIATATVFDDGDARFEEVMWREDGILVVEDRIPSSYFDRVIFHLVDPAAGTRREVGTLYAEDYIRMVEW